MFDQNTGLVPRVGDIGHHKVNCVCYPPVGNQLSSF